MRFTEKGWLQEVELAKNRLQPGEQVVYWANGTVKLSTRRKTSRQAVVIATSQRVYVFTSMMFGSFELEEFPYEVITSLESKGGFLGQTLEFVALGSLLKISRIRRGQPDQLIEFMRTRINLPQDVVNAEASQ